MFWRPPVCPARKPQGSFVPFSVCRKSKADSRARSNSSFSCLVSILPMSATCLPFLLLPAVALFVSPNVSQAQNVYGDYKVVGTGADAGISFEILATVPPLTQGLQPTFSFVSCTVPAGESCNQAAYGAAGGQIRLTTISGPNVINRTWSFSSLLHTGVYIGQTGSGVEPGYLVVSGADATAGQPQSNATSSTFQYPLEVTVNDSAPAYQSGVTVTYTAPGSGPSASLPNGGVATTDSTGRARLTPTANNIPGAYPITATADVGGSTFQTSFIAANVNTANATGACQVTTSNDDFSAGSLRYQVAACGRGGTITFASGINTVNVEAGQDIPLTQDLTIDGDGGVTINGNGVSRIFFIAGGSITLQNLTLQNGVAVGGSGGVGSTAGGGGAAGMGGAIFVNAGSLTINNVTFSNNQAVGGNGGAVTSGFFLGGGGGVGEPGGTSASGINGNGGGGGDFGSSGGGGTGGAQNGQGDGAGGGNGGSGAFSGGASGGLGSGGFGGGGGGGIVTGGPGGTFAGSGGGQPNLGGGGAAGLGGAIFMRNGTLSLTSAIFVSNIASGGAGESGGGNGQGKGGALYISSTASAASTTALPTFSADAASSAGAGTACNTVVGSNALDTNDICGVLTGPATHFAVIAPSPVTSYVAYQITVKALDAQNNVVTGYTGTVHLTSTDPGFVNGTGDSMLTNGVGTFGVAMKQAGTQTITATDTVDPSTTGISNSILVNPGAPDRVILSAPPAINAGESLTFTVTVTDIYGNQSTGYNGTLHFTSTDAAAALPGNSVLAGGTGSFSAVLRTAGTQTVTATDTVTSSITGTSNTIAVSIPTLVVTSTADSGTGSLRAALAAAATSGSANITFDPTVFATPQTITVASTLTLPSNTTIVGATSGSGASLKNLVKVSGGGASSDFPVFTVNGGVTGAAMTNLIIANGHINSQGGGILNSGQLTITSCTLTNNYAGGYATGGGNGGGAIFATGGGSLSIVRSTFTGNTSAPGGAIGADSGQVTITDSTFYGNTAIDGRAGGAIFVNSANVSVSSSTFSGNSAAGGGGIFNYGTLTVSNSILAGNPGGDCGAGGSSSCPANGTNGNVVGVAGISLAPLGSYGGPTQTMLPLPGSPAICAINPSAATGTDQRGESRTTTYSSATCQDAGAAQTNYAMSFTTNPATSESSGVPFAAAVTLTESGSPFTGAGVSIPVTLSGGATLTGSPVSASTSAGIANYSLTVSNLTSVSGLQLDADLTLDDPIAISATSNSFSLNPVSAPVISASFSPSTIVSGSNSTLTISVTNPNSTSLSNVVFNNTVPPGTTLVTQTGGNCSTAATGGGTISLNPPTFSSTSTSLGAGASCNVTLEVRGNTVGTAIDTTSSVTATGSPAGVPATATLTINAAVTQLGFRDSPQATVTAGGNAGGSIQVAEENAGASIVTTAADSITLTVTGPGSYAKTYTATAASGIATFDLSAAALTAVGTYTYTASINTSPSVTNAQASETVSAAVAATETAVSGTPQVTMIGSPFASPLKVKVTDQYGNAVAGATVVFAAPATGAGASFSTPAVTAADGTTTVTATANGIASTSPYSVTAAVAGVGTSATFSLTNAQHPTSLVVSSSSASLVYGQPVIISASITPANVAGSSPTGSVSFYDGTAALTPASTVAAAGAAYTVSAPAVGSHSYAALYGGDANFSASALSAASAVTIGKANSTLTGPTPAPVFAYGAGGDITVFIAGQYSGAGIATPSGNVTYTIGTGSPQTAIIASGAATLPVPTTLAAGSYTVSASYTGDSDYNPSASIQFTLTIGKTTASVLLGDLSQTYTGRPLSVTTTTAPPGLTVDTTYNGASAPPTMAGNYAVLATINDANYQGSATGTLAIAKAASTTTLSLSGNSVNPGQSVTMTATVTSAALGTPTGSVSFFDGTTLLNTALLTSGTAAYTTTALAPGAAHAITAMYSGDLDFTPSSASSATIVVSSLDFTIAVSGATTASVMPGASASWQVTVAPTYGNYPGTVDFQAAGLPSGATASFSPPSLAATAGPQTLTLTIRSAATTGMLHPESTDPKAPLLAFTCLALLGAGRMRRRGRILRRMLCLLVLLGAGMAAITLSGCGSNSGFFARAPQNYPVTVTATSGSLQHSTTVNLNVQ